MRNERPLREIRRLSVFVLMACLSLCAFAQKLTVKGRVVDAANEAIIGASVQVKGTANGSITDMDGNFTLQADPGATLVVSYIGYQTREVKAASTVNVTLSEDNELLDEVVVIGYGSVKRRDVTTAVSTVSTDDIQNRPILSAAQAMQGKAAGVSVIQPTGQPGGDLNIRVRGTTSFNGSNDPLYVVDGVPVDNIKFLSPNDIASMQILKDASSAAIYGSRAANGVVLITTKAGQAGNAKVSLSIQAGFTQVANKIESLNTAQYKELMDEIGLITLPDGLTDQTDWWDETYTTGNVQNYQVSVSDGNEKKACWRRPSSTAITSGPMWRATCASGCACRPTSPMPTTTATAPARWARAPTVAARCCPSSTPRSTRPSWTRIIPASTTTISTAPISPARWRTWNVAATTATARTD